MFYLLIAMVCFFILSANYARLRPHSAWRFGVEIGIYTAIGGQVALWLETLMSILGDDDLRSGDAMLYGLYGAVLIIGAGAFAFSPGVRQQFGRWAGQSYQGEDYVHRTALALMFLMGSYIASLYVMVGGLEGVADIIAVESDSEKVRSQVQDMLLLVIVALLGVGTFVRRSWHQSMARLSVRSPIGDDWRWGIGVGVGLFVALIPISMLLSAFFSPEALEAQQVASSEVFRAYSGSLWLGLTLAITAGIGEEVLFRGALQPVFGIPVATVFFVLVHLQYTLTPAWIIILGVALAFAYLRERISTTSAIIAHTVYNAMPFLLFSMIVS